MDRDINDVIRSIIARIQAKDFGISFFVDVLTACVWLLTWLKAGPQTYGERSDSLGLLIELNEELGGEVPLSGPITSVLIALVIRALIQKALEVISESGLPAEVVEWIKQILESLQSKI